MAVMATKDIQVCCRPADTGVSTRIATIPKVQTSKPTQIGPPCALERAKKMTCNSPLSLPLRMHAGRYLK